MVISFKEYVNILIILSSVGAIVPLMSMDINEPILIHTSIEAEMTNKFS